MYMHHPQKLALLAVRLNTEWSFRGQGWELVLTGRVVGPTIEPQASPLCPSLTRLSARIPLCLPLTLPGHPVSLSSPWAGLITEAVLISVGVQTPDYCCETGRGVLCVAYYISHVQSLYAHPHIDGHVQWTIPSVLRINIYTFMQIKYEVTQTETMVCASLLFLPSVVSCSAKHIPPYEHRGQSSQPITPSTCRPLGPDGN